MKKKWVVVLIVSVLAAIGIGFFVYKKVEENSKGIQIKFIDSYNNETISTQDIEVGQEAEIPKEPTHDGCKFSGWYTEDGKKIESFENLDKDLVVYAKCESLYYKVKFYDTLAKKVVDTQKVKHGEDAVAPVAPEHYGYNFIRWKGKYTSVKSDLTINAIYGAQSAKYVVKYYTVDNDNESLYTSKTISSYVNRKVKASIISIGGYEYDSSNPHNKLSGRVSKDNSLVLKVYYGSRTYKVSVFGEEETEYNYNDEFTLPLLQKTATLTYQENDAVINKLGSNAVDLTLTGYCKNAETCEDAIPAGEVIKVTEDAVFYPVWSMELELNLPAGEGYLDGDNSYSFVKWTDEDGNDYEASDKLTFTDDMKLRAIYKKDGSGEDEPAEYVVETYHDGTLYSSVTEYGKVGEQILGSKFAVNVEGYNIDSYTDSIFLSEKTEENVIEIYYVSEGSGSGDEPGDTPGTGDEPGETPGSGDEPGDTPGTGDEPGDTPGTGDEPGETPGSGDEPGDTPGTGDEPGDTPGSGDEPGDTPGSGDEPGDTPGSGDEPGDTPGSGDEPGDTPGSGDEPGDTPGSGSEPSDTPGSGDEPGDTPGSGDEPGNTPGSGDEPGDTPGSGSEPGDTPGGGSEPGDTPGSGSEPGDTPGGGSDGPNNSGDQTPSQSNNDVNQQNNQSNGSNESPSLGDNPSDGE